MLTDERLYHRKRLSGTRRSNDPCPTERIGDITPAIVHTSLVIVYHRDVDTVLVVHQCLTLLEALVLEVEAVFTQLAVEVLSHAVKSLMNEHDTEDGSQQIQNPVNGVRT